MDFFLFLFIPIVLVLSHINGPKKEGCVYSNEDSFASCFAKINYDKTSKSKIRTVEIMNWREELIRPHEISKHFPNATNITITNSNITTLKGRFPADNTIKILRLTNLLIEEIQKHFFHSLQHLQFLDLRGNHLQTLDLHMMPFLNSMQEVFLADNKWNCSLDLEWVQLLNATVTRDLEKVKCSGTPYPEKPLIAIANFLENVHSQCPKDCFCSLPNVVRDPDTQILEPLIEVNCANKDLEELPPVLPKDTTTLRVEGNKIESLEPLLTNPLYSSVLDLYLDNNLVDNIDKLEGSNWISNFRVFSLAGNKIAQVPTYALDNALQLNPNMPIAVRLFLGGNPWRCDCVFTPRFQDMLRKYETQIKDIEDVKCSYVEGDENSLLPIMELTRSSVCRSPSEYSIRALDLLNGVLASLIVLILGKLAYDYYYFKKTGKLPWIVTKMP